MLSNLLIYPIRLVSGLGLPSFFTVLTFTSFVYEMVAVFYTTNPREVFFIVRLTLPRLDFRPSRNHKPDKNKRTQLVLHFCSYVTDSKILMVIYLFSYKVFFIVYECR